MLSTKSSQLLVIKTAFSCATKLLLACLYTVFLVACVSSGGKSKEQNITQLSDIDLDTVEYAEDSDEVSDERFAAPEQEAEEVANPYDNPQYADSDEVTAPADADVYDAYDNPQSSDEATAEVDSVESTEENISDEVFVAENGLDYSDDSVDESQPVEPEAIVDEPVYEQVGIDENGLPIMAIVEPVDPLEKFGPNPYLQNPPQVSSEAAATFSEALNLMRAEDFEKAAELLELLSDQNPQLSGPAYNRAVIAFKAEDMALTLTWLNISLERNAYNLNAKNLKANVFKQQAKFSEAEEEYKSIIAMWGAYLPAYKNLGILYDMYMGKLALALEQYRLYEALSPEENKQLKGWIAVISRKIEPAPAPVEEPQAVQ
ncbi:MAG: hypothetical protein KAG18_08360, partial [Sinobacterium sp.]|nr:hypothetical protein [Sinobacterium sp.]